MTKPKHTRILYDYPRAQLMWSNTTDAIIIQVGRSVSADPAWDNINQTVDALRLSGRRLAPEPQAQPDRMLPPAHHTVSTNDLWRRTVRMLDGRS